MKKAIAAIVIGVILLMDAVVTIIMGNFWPSPLPIDIIVGVLLLRWGIKRRKDELKKRAEQAQNKPSVA